MWIVSFWLSYLTDSVHEPYSLLICDPIMYSFIYFFFLGPKNVYYLLISINFKIIYNDCSIFSDIMYGYIHLWLLVSIALSDISCDSGQTYVKFEKYRSMINAHLESFKVYAGSTLLFTASNFTTNKLYTFEQCLIVIKWHGHFLSLRYNTIYPGSR